MTKTKDNLTAQLKLRPFTIPLVRLSAGGQNMPNPDGGLAFH
jgi:hypothetical protein